MLEPYQYVDNYLKIEIRRQSHQVAYCRGVLEDNNLLVELPNGKHYKVPIELVTFFTPPSKHCFAGEPRSAYDPVG